MLQRGDAAAPATSTQGFLDLCFLEGAGEGVVAAVLGERWCVMSGATGDAWCKVHGVLCFGGKWLVATTCVRISD